MKACFEGWRIVLIPECELRLLLPLMLSQRDDLRAQAAVIRMELEQAGTMGWVPHNTNECFMRSSAGQLEILMRVGEKEARLSQAINHAIQRLLVLNPLAVVNRRIRSAGACLLLLCRFLDIIGFLLYWH